MEIYSFDRLASTQRYLVEGIRRGTITAPAAVWTREQYDGIGSRENRWIGEAGNFFASFALYKRTMPSDLPLASVSIYVSWLMRTTLHEAGCQEVWLKWPNDLYVGEKKVGGTVTKAVGDVLVWGIGINLKKPVKNFGVVQCPIDAGILFNIYLKRLENLPTWKQVFSEYKLEFERSRYRDVHIDGAKYALKHAVLLEDGALEINGRKVYSGR